MKINKKYFELIFGTKQHFQLRFLPYGFGYDRPTIVFSLFLFTLYLKLPFIYQTKNLDIDYGIQFLDIDEKHWLPDELRLSFGKYTKSYDLFWHRKLFNISYETKSIKSLQVKNINNIKTKDSIKYFKQVKINNKLVNCEYYKEILEYKYKIFKWFIKYNPKFYYIFNINMIFEDHTTYESIPCENKNIDELFEDYCIKHNIEMK